MATPYDERRSSERNAPTLGAEPELVTHYRDPIRGASGYVVIDTLATGVAFGGVRVRKNLRWTDLAQLARIGTIRYQLARVAIGGARVGLDYDPQAPDAKDVLARFLTAMAPVIDRHLSLGSDLNVPGPMLEELLAQNNLPWRMCAVQRKEGWPTERWNFFQQLLEQKVDGMPLREAQVARSVAQGVMTLASSMFRRPVTVSIAGSGQFGYQIARILSQAGATVVAMSGPTVGIHAASGIRPDILQTGLSMGQSLDPSHMFITREEFYALPVDVMVLAASGDSINIDNVGRVRASLVVEAAQLSVSRHAEKVMVSRGTGVLPSFAITSGAVLVAEAALHGRVNDARGAVDLMCEQVDGMIKELARLSSALRIPLRDAGIRLAFHRWTEFPSTAAEPEPEPLFEEAPEVV